MITMDDLWSFVGTYPLVDDHGGAPLIVEKREKERKVSERQRKTESERSCDEREKQE